MKAMILAAGYGTRLLPLTEHKPKALIEIKGIPLIELVIEKLIKSGYNSIIINLHHHAEKLKQFIRQNNNFGIDIQFSDETDQLLDTGGGILKAKWFFDDDKPFLIYNVDILSDIDLTELYNFHNRTNALISLAVRDRNTVRKLVFDSDNQLCEWVNTSTGQRKISRQVSGERQQLAYSGIHMINPQLFDLIQEKGAFSIMDVYLRLATNYFINAYIHNYGQWYDIGKYQQLIEFNKNNDLSFLNIK
jgi:NDP-sugar pyrophosphorylase family protein